MSDDAVIVSVARTPIGKANRGAFNITHGVDLAGHAAHHAVARSGIDPALIEDSIWGCGYPRTGFSFCRASSVVEGRLHSSISSVTSL